MLQRCIAALSFVAAVMSSEQSERTHWAAIIIYEEPSKVLMPSQSRSVRRKIVHKDSISRADVLFVRQIRGKGRKSAVFSKG